MNLIDSRPHGMIEDCRWGDPGRCRWAERDVVPAEGGAVHHEGVPDVFAAGADGIGWACSHLITKT